MHLPDWADEGVRGVALIRDWQLQSTKVTAPSTATKVCLYLELEPSSPSKGGAWYDQVVVVPGG